MAARIARSSTGVYHLAYGNSTACNGRSLNVIALVTTNQIEKASEQSFCKKCFSSKHFATHKDQALHIANLPE